MKTLPISKPGAWLALFATSALPLWTAGAHAQEATAAAAPPAFRSAFEGYRPYTDEKMVNWKEANDNVGRIGGWREYAKQARQPAAKPQPPDAAAKPDPHAGHTRP